MKPAPNTWLRPYFDALETAAREGGEHAADAVERVIEAHALDMAHAVSAKIGELPGWQDNPRSTLDYGTAFAHALRGNVAALLAFEAYSIAVGDKRHTGSFVVASELIAPAINLSAALAARRAWTLLDAYANNAMHLRVLLAADSVIPEGFFAGSDYKAQAGRLGNTLSRLASEAANAARDILSKLGDAPRTESEALRLVDGMLYADAVFADHLESYGTQGEANAKKIRDASRERAKDDSLAPGARWVLWADPKRASGDVEPHERTGCRWLGALLDTLWHDVVRPEINAELERSKKHRPAIVRAIHTDRLLPLMTRQMDIPELDDGLIRDAKGKVIGRIALTTGASIEAVRNGALLFATVPAQRLIKKLVLSGFDAFEQGAADPRRVAFVGGWEALADSLGIGIKYTSHLRDIARAGQCIEWSTPHVQAGGLWTWSERRGSRAGPGEVAFVIGDPLMPGYSAIMRGKSLSARMARRLIPELRHEPPMGDVDPSSHGAVWVYHRLWLQELVDLSEQLASRGYALVNSTRRAAMAKDAGIRPNQLERVIDGFIAGDDKAPPLLKRETDGRDELWTLADPHELERAFIVHGGQSRIDGKPGGKRRRAEAAKTKRRKGKA